MRLAAAKTLEIVRALCVLGLFFLNFAHAPLSVAAPGGDVLTSVADQGFCGSPPGDGVDHAPCHVCRIGGGADLPAQTEVARPAFDSRDVDYGACASSDVAYAVPVRPTARGPPAT